MYSNSAVSFVNHRAARLTPPRLTLQHDLNAAAVWFEYVDDTSGRRHQIWFDNRATRVTCTKYMYHLYVTFLMA